MIDHIGIEVADYETSKQFYSKALAPLKYKLLMEMSGFAGFGVENGAGPIANFWIHQGASPSHNTHIAFTAKDRLTVDSFYKAAISAGGACNGKPGVREIYHPNYYGAFILDPDGNNIEAVCHKPPIG
ncbi:MAG: glyoxalase [Gammaproteobacteria bacterium RIFCSPHIGHO2_12_FULL_35_23]|nr:MAG: glyoxalase [Gammaproteobacteria bacterium RIFCSPHIGHO2_12_FULL_35_23]